MGGIINKDIVCAHWYPQFGEDEALSSSSCLPQIACLSFKD